MEALLRKLSQTAFVVLATAATLVAAHVAEGRERLVLDYRGAEFYGNSVLHLKQDLKRAYPYLPIEDAELVSIQLETKLYDYSGDVFARVGGYTSERRAVYGNPRDYHSPYSYNTLYFSIPGRASDYGPWQILFNGSRFRVRQVVAEIDYSYYPEPGRPGRPGQPGRPGRPGRPGQPGRPQPPTERYAEIDCSSWDSRPSYCTVGFHIQQARVIQQYSTSACIEGRSFFIEGSSLRVQNGCRARFGVTGF